MSGCQGSPNNNWYVTDHLTMWGPTFQLLLLGEIHCIPQRCSSWRRSSCSSTVKRMQYDVRGFRSSCKHKMSIKHWICRRFTINDHLFCMPSWQEILSEVSWNVSCSMCSLPELWTIARTSFPKLWRFFTSVSCFKLVFLDLRDLFLEGELKSMKCFW